MLLQMTVMKSQWGYKLHVVQKKVKDMKMGTRRHEIAAPPSCFTGWNHYFLSHIVHYICSFLKIWWMVVGLENTQLCPCLNFCTFWSSDMFNYVHKSTFAQIYPFFYILRLKYYQLFATFSFFDMVSNFFHVMGLIAPILCMLNLIHALFVCIFLW